MALPFFTVGHSTRSISEFIELLAASEIGLVVDVRSVPRSRTNPQYNLETLPKSLSESKIAYEHMAELGGLRPRAHDIAPSINGFWENKSFHNYADYAMSAGFGLVAPGCARQCPALRCDVCRGGLVAMSSPHHYRLSAYCRRAGLSHPWARKDRASKIDEGCQATSRRSADLSAAITLILRHLLRTKSRRLLLCGYRCPLLAKSRHHRMSG